MLYPVFRARDIKYFDSNLDVPAIKVKENYNIYYNIFSFINRLRVKANTINIMILRQNLNTYLLDTAKQQYINKLLYIIRVSLRSN